MIETIFFVIIVSLFLAIIGYVIYSITNNKYPKNNNEVDEVLKECDHKLISLINPKLQQVIDEANQKKIASEIRNNFLWKEIINTEKERLLKDDWIYNKIGKSLLYTDHGNLYKSANDYRHSVTTCEAIKLIPGLRVESKLDGKIITIYINE